MKHTELTVQHLHIHACVEQTSVYTQYIREIRLYNLELKISAFKSFEDSRVFL